MIALILIFRTWRQSMLTRQFSEPMLNGEIFYSLKEAQIIIEDRRKHHNTKRLRSALGYRPPAPKTIVPMATRPVMH